MAATTLGSGDTSAYVAATIQRRGSDGTPLAGIWTALAAGGAALAIVAMFVTWYSAIRTANAWYSGWMPPLALLLIIAGAVLLVAKQTGLISRSRVSADLFLYATLASGSVLLMLRQLTKGDLSESVYILMVPALVFVVGFSRALDKPGPNTLAIEQVSLGLATYGATLIIIKRLVDAQYATGGWVWGLLAALAVIVAALIACQYLGILSMFQVALFTALSASIVILAILLAQVIGDGAPVLNERAGDFWNGTLRSSSDDERLGISQGLIGSFWIAMFVVFLTFPIGIAAAVYLEEYAPRDQMSLREAHGRGRLRRWIASKLTGTLDIIVRNLAGVPSVVYGLLGLFLFVKSIVLLQWIMNGINWFWAPIHNLIFDSPYEDIVVEPGQSTLFAGGVTLAILVLPIVVITAAEAIRAVPQSLREGAFGVGATKWEVIRSQVMPFAAPGILTGTLLALARAVGEAAPLILVGAITGRLAPRGSMFDGFDQFFGQFADRFTAMPIVIVGWVANSGRDAGFGPAAGAAIVVLLLFVILMNSVAVLLRSHFEKKRA